VEPFAVVIAALALMLGLLGGLLLRRGGAAGGAAVSAAEVERLQSELERAAASSVAAVANDALARLVEVTQHQLRTQQEAADTRARAATTGLRDVVEPLQANLAALGQQVQDLERRRAGAYAELDQKLGSTAALLETLRTTTAELNTAMRRSDVRGHWGELQLRRVIELAGLKEHVSFSEQRAVVGEGSGRPDVTVHLTDGKVLYVDAKAPMAAFFAAIAEADRDAQRPHLERHASDLLGHVRELERRAYVADGSSLPFMVLFVPNEASLAAALEVDPTLLEQAMTRGVALTGPTSLVMMLTNVSASWRQHAFAENAEQIVREVGELHKRFGTFADHLNRVGKQLESSVKAYNDAVGSFDRRLMPSARRVEAIAGVATTVEAPAEVTELPVTPRAAGELADGSPAGA
jgi:DNA recombination protein RmuC